MTCHAAPAYNKHCIPGTAHIFGATYNSDHNDNKWLLSLLNMHTPLAAVANASATAELTCLCGLKIVLVDTDLFSS